MTALFLRYRIVAIVFSVIFGLAVSLWLASRYAEQRAWEDRSSEAHGQLQLYAQSIQTLVDRFRSVPQLLSMDSDIQALLQAPNDPQLRDKLNRRLELLNAAAGASVLYLIDRQGLTLAASNWNEWSSFVGSNYGFRPYFQDALHRTSGRYFAVGVTTGVPGYFLSHAVYDDNGAVTGVLVVKLELEELQREWVGQPGVLLVADSYGVVILSSRPAWRFRALEELDELDQAELVEVRKYAERPLELLAKEPGRYFEGNADWMIIDGPDGRHSYLWQRQELASEAWTLHLLIEENSLGDTARSYRLAAAGVWLTLVFLVLFLLQRRKNQRLQASIRENLEREVTLRTAELREAQEGLVHAAKMAALGQMSAAMAHEINQPLTAIQMHLGSLGLLLDNGREREVREGLIRIDGLLQRMASLTSHLKSFARKSPAGLNERLLLSDVLEQALLLLAPRLRSEQVELRREIRSEARVYGDAIRLEQVILNLLNNALDAMLDSPQRVLGVVIELQGDSCLLQVSDSGGGILEEHLGSVFEPFFTTKPVGEGLGLGLAISYGIVRDLGGNLEVRNGREGAVFTLRLQRAG
ncbi:sensor histidine kinase [Phytopseudomonas daroniae]|uniref:sensor histidine kinase n=1 Tax=Phytopseudomonas daroniae TaxID=2487519 RepID=UPI001038487F|nr:ATP-binding protein [Pseudomonas daroniae]TBU75525.1 two-component sensor histidine kinase [Pseudomonas daroniae]